MISNEIRVSGNFVQIFGISFLQGGYAAASRMLAEGGFMVVPSAPSLVPIRSDAYYHSALKESDFAIPDSGLMVLLLKYLFRVDLQRISGLEFLETYLHDQCRSRSLFLVEPTLADHEANRAYLNRIGFPDSPDQFYVAPMYTERVIEDRELLQRLEAARPDIVLINLGGGVQE